MRFRLRFLALPPLALSILYLTASGKEPRIPLGSDPVMHAVQVPLAPGDPGRTTVGRLHYLGGVRLTSPDLGFSGFSALSVAGDHFTLLSDRGNLVRFRMGQDWRPFDIRFADLPAGPGASAFKGDRDSESLARDPKSGDFWIGFESTDAIFRYDADFRTSPGRAYPLAMRHWPQNGGPESMVRLADGRFLVIGETARPKGGAVSQRELLLFPRDPTQPGGSQPVRLAYVPPKGYDPSDAALLPDGRLLVLVRRFAARSLFTVKIELVDIRGMHAGQVLRGTEIADFSPPFQHDNFEGLAVQREGDSLAVWMVSDDNEQWWQQTLLLKFRLDL